MNIFVLRDMDMFSKPKVFKIFITSSSARGRLCALDLASISRDFWKNIIFFMFFGVILWWIFSFVQKIKTSSRKKSWSETNTIRIRKVFMYTRMTARPIFYDIFISYIQLRPLNVEYDDERKEHVRYVKWENNNQYFLNKSICSTQSFQKFWARFW